jgi:predicted lipoprotein with Yx(FWY)xxD motif
MSLEIRRFLVIPSIVVIAAIAAACSSSGSATTAPSVAAPTTSASAEPSSAAPSSAAPSESASSSATGVSLALADSKFGKIIVDGNGNTLYIFTPDEDAGGKPTCKDQCAANWPALKADAATSVTAGAGLDASKISVVAAVEGGNQVKYGEYPLYFFANDKAAGDVNGQGILSKWYVVGADGEPIKS